MIAISYRREDSLPVTGRLYDRLQMEFGKGKVFMDFDSIPYGVDFREHIKQTLAKAEVLLVMIGPKWLGRSDGRKNRLDDPNDFVRFEIAEALRSNIPIIPVLIDQTPMPSAESLPQEIQPLSYRNGLGLDSGIDFHYHVQRLISGIRKFFGGDYVGPFQRLKLFLTASGGASRRIGVAAAFLIVFGLGTAWYFWGNMSAKNQAKVEVAQTRLDAGNRQPEPVHPIQAPALATSPPPEPEVRAPEPLKVNPVLLRQCKPNNVRVVVSLPRQRAWLMCNEQVAADAPISSGQPGHTTPGGYFTVLEKAPNHSSSIYVRRLDSQGRFVDEGDQTDAQSGPTPFAGMPMKWFLRLTNDVAMYSDGSPDLPAHPVTHGNILLTPEAAKLFYDHVKVGTNVFVIDQKYIPRSVKGKHHGPFGDVDPGG
jgi:L,D-transpeptidase catalytic domain/TIR domain